MSYLISALFLFSLNSFAQVPDADNETPDLPTFCKSVLEYKNNLSVGESKGWKRILKMFFQSGSKTSVMTVGPEQKRRTSIERQVFFFSLGAVEALTRDEEKGLSQLEKKREEIQRYLADLIKTSSVDQCVQKAQKLSFSPEVIADYEKLNLANKIGTRKIQAQESMKTIKSLGPRADPATTIMAYQPNTWGQILQTMMKNQTYNVVLVLHASKAGRLFDATGNEVPTQFFETLKKYVSSITLYSCHTQTVRKAYGLDKLAESLPVFLPGFEKPWSEVDLTPLELLPNFFSNLEDYLPRKKESAFVNKNLCELSFQGQFITPVNLTLNGVPVYLQTASQGVVNAKYYFDCSTLKEKGNRLFIQGSQERYLGDRIESENRFSLNNKDLKVEKIFSEEGKVRSVVYSD